MDAIANQAPARPVAGLAAYVREHLAITNAMLLAAGFLVGLIDFLMPWMRGVAPKIVYSATALPVLLTLLASVWPQAAIKVLEGLGFRQATGAVPVWRRPAWRLAALILLAATTFGVFSIAKAHEGGAIASASHAVRSLQEMLAPLMGEAKEIRAGVDSANAKLDRIVDAVDPDNAADKCPDLACAASEGASPQAVRRLIARGAKLPPDKVNRGEIWRRLSHSKAPGRLDVAELMLAQGLDPDMRHLPNVLSDDEMTPAARDLAMKAGEGMGLTKAYLEADPMAKLQGLSAESVAWNEFMGCILRNRGGVSVIEEAALRGDAALHERLVNLGVKPAAGRIDCPWEFDARRPKRGRSVHTILDGPKASITLSN